MNRKFEKILAYVGGSWQVLTGLITIIPYSALIKRQGFNVTGSSQVSINATQSMIDSIYSFSTTIGILFVGLGLLNLYLSRRMRNEEVEKKIPAWFITCGIISLFSMDFISCIVLVASGVIALARNKSIVIMNN